MQHKVFTWMLVCAVLVTAPIVRGDTGVANDANGDGFFSSADPLFLLDALFTPGAPPLVCPADSDCNGDGAVNSSDAVCMLGIIPCPSILGDVDGDGAVTGADVFDYLNYLYYGDPPVLCEADADCNGDGDLTLADGLCIYDLIPCPSVFGDANTDGSFNYRDVVYLYEYLFSGGPPVRCHEDADCDGNGSLSLGDVFCMLGLLPCPGVAGDANGDGVFNEYDPKYLLNYLFLEGPAVFCTEDADCNGDGSLDIADPICMYGLL